MPNLMEVNWVRPRHSTGGVEPYHFWLAADIVDKMEFVSTWAADPRGHFAKFSSVGTQGVMQILSEIADHRTTFAEAGLDQTKWASFPTDPGLFNDTIDVVKYSPFHCGGWLGLLTLTHIAENSATVVDRPNPSGSMSYVTWPPAPGRGLLEILAWLMQSIHMSSENFATGARWTPNANMLLFLRGQKATGGPVHNGAATSGLTSFSDVVRGLVYENADKQLLHFYVRHLRGHGPEEAGSVHHLNQMVSTHDADDQSRKQNLELALDALLRGFPAAWAQLDSGHWNGAVADHVGEWRMGTGNHRAGLTWLSEMVQRRVDEWGADAIYDEISGTRTTQTTVGTTLTTSLSTAVTQVETVRTTIGIAYRSQDTATWQTSLENALTRLESLTTTTGGGTENTTGGSFGNESSVMIGGETGAIEELLLGKVTGEATTTIKTMLSTQFRTHLEHERSSSESTSTTSRTVTTESLSSMRERSHSMSQEASESLTRSIQRGQSLSQSVQSLIREDGDLRQQTSLVLRGLQTAKVAIDDTLNNL